MKCGLIISIGSAACLLSGCGTIHHLPGHTSANERHPPDIVLTEGQKVRMLTAGLERFGICAPPGLTIKIKDPEVVGLEGEQWVAYLVGRKPGTTTVIYNSPDTSPANQGFRVTVRQAQPRP